MNIGVEQLVSAFEEKNIKFLEDFINSGNRPSADVFRMFVTAGFYALASGDEFVAQRLAEYLQIRLENPACSQAFLDILRSDEFTDQQLQYCVSLLEQNLDRNFKVINLSETLERHRLQVEWKSELTERLEKYGYNATYRQIISKILPNPTLEDAAEMLLLFSSPEMVNTNRESVSQLNKEFEVQIEVEANEWLVEDVFKYLKDKGITVVNVVCNMKLQNIFYSPEALLENTIVALNAENPQCCYCSDCSMKSNDGFIETLLKNFEINKYVRMTYCIGLLTLCNNIPKEFNQKVFCQLMEVTPEIITAFNKISVQTFYINISKTECSPLLSLPEDVAYNCPLERALDVCAELLDESISSEGPEGAKVLPNRLCCLKQHYEEGELDALMESTPESPINPLSFLWRSVSLLKTLKALYEDFPREVEYLLSVNQSKNELQEELDARKYTDPVAKCPEQISMTILNIQPTPLLKATLALSLNRFLVATGTQRRLDDLSQRLIMRLIGSPFFAFSLQIVWRGEQEFSQNIFSYIDRYKLMESVINDCADFEFLLDVFSRCCEAVVAHQLNHHFLKFGIPFAEAVCLYVIKKLCMKKTAQNRNFDVTPYGYVYVPNLEEEVQCVLRDYVIEAEKEITCSNFDYELKNVFVSEIDIPEHLIEIYYRILVEYMAYFKHTLPEELEERYSRLFSSALTILKAVYPNIEALSTAKQTFDDQIMTDVKHMLTEWAREDKRGSLFNLIASKAENQPKWFEYVIQILCRAAQQQSFFDEFVGTEYEDMCAVAYLRIDLFRLIGQIVGSEVLSNEELPQLLNPIIQYAFSTKTDDAALSKAALVAMCQELKRREASDAFCSLADFIINSPAASHLRDDDSLKFFRELAGNSPFKLIEVTKEYREAREQKERENENILQDKTEFLVNSFEDEQIAQFIVELHSPMRLLEVNQSSASPNDQCKKAFEKVMMLFAPPNNVRIDWKKHIPTELEISFMQDRVEFAEFYVQKYLIEMDMEQCYNIPLIHDSFLELLIYLRQPELLQAISQQCILTLFRLVYSSYPLSDEEIQFRRQKAVLLGSHIGKLHFRAEVLGLSGLSSRELDFPVLIQMASRCGTLSVVTRFYTDFCQAVFALNDFITPRCGYFREILEQICVALRCRHGWTCTQCRDASRAEYEQGGDGERFYAYSDIDWLCNRYYVGENVGAGDEHEIEIIQKEVIHLPETLLEEQNISILQRAEAHEVPLNITAALINSNRSLVWAFDSIQICQRSGRVQQVWSRYVDQAYEMAQHLLDCVGIRQTSEQYENYLVKYALRIAHILIRNACLIVFSQEILDEILNRFEFEDWVPEKLQMLVQEKILYQLSLMAAEHVLSHIYRQVKSLIMLRNSKLSKNNKEDYCLQDNGDFDGFATPFEEKSNYLLDDGNDDDLFDKIEILTDIFSPKMSEQRHSCISEKTMWDELREHENFAVFPFVEVRTGYLLLCNEYLIQSNQLSSSATDFCSQAQCVIGRALGVSADIPVEQQIQQFFTVEKFDSKLERYLITKYVVNECNIINNMSNYVQISKPITYDEAIKNLARLSKSILSMENELAGGSHYSSLISVYNLSPNHPLNVQLHSLRIVFNEIWRHNEAQSKHHMAFLLEYAISALTIPLEVSDDIERSSIKCAINSTKKNLTTMYELSYQCDYPIADALEQVLQNYENEMRTQFLTIFPQDSKIFEYLKDQRHLIKNLCLIPHSCREQVSMIQSLPFAIFQVISAVYQDNSQASQDAKNMIIAAFERIIEASVHAELCGQTNERVFGPQDCVYAFVVGTSRYGILRYDEIDKLFNDSVQSTVQHFYAASQPLGVPLPAVQNKCVLTISAAASALLEACYNVSEDLVAPRAEITLSNFPLILHRVEELYVASIETVAIIARSSQNSSGENESLFAATVNLPECLENLLFMQRAVNHGALEQRKPSMMAEISTIGFRTDMTDFYMGKTVESRIAELEEAARRQMKLYEAEHARKTQAGPSMLDNQVQEVIKAFETAIEDNCTFSTLQQPLISNAIKDLYDLGYAANDYYSQCIIDSILFATFSTVHEDCKRDISLISRKLRQIDTMCLLFYYLIESIPELEVDGTEKQTHTALILFRIQQFYAVFSSLSVSPADKLRFLTALRNYDLLGCSFSYARLSGQLVEQISEDACEDPELRDEECFEQLSNIFTHRALFSLQRSFLSQETFYNREHRICFSQTLSQALYAYRPQQQPQFVSHYVSLISESTLLGALLRYCPDFSFGCQKQLNFIEHRTYETQPTFECYYVLFQALCLYCHGYYAVPNQQGLKEYIRMLLRLIIVLARDFPEFIAEYRLRISEVLHEQAGQMRSYLYAFGAGSAGASGAFCAPSAFVAAGSCGSYGAGEENGFLPLTDDIAGLLALPQTDFSELLQMDEISDEMLKVLREEHYTNYAHDVIAAFKSFVMKPLNYGEVAPVLYYITMHLIYIQLDRKRVEETTGFRIISDLLRDLITQDFGKFIVAQIFVFVANPSIETYCFAAVVQALSQQKNSGAAVAEYIIENIKYRAEKSYGCQVLNRRLEIVGK